MRGEWTDVLGEGRHVCMRHPARAAAAVAVTLMLWSLLAARPSTGDIATVTEPEDLAAYATFADAAPVQLYLDHQTRLIPLGPQVARSLTDVSMPSQVSGIAWLVDGGLANGLHGTSTGTKVPTESSAQQPSGEEEQEFLVAGGPIGHPAFANVRAGRAAARATYGEEPRGYANAFLGSLAVLPAAGAAEDPPGTFDPDARFPGGTDATDPAPRGQMAVLSVASIASTSESFREGPLVTSVAVAELKDVNIGNRTSDNRCTNCIRIDTLRVEAFAQANGTPGGARAAYRVTGGRACRRALNAETGLEEDRCLPLEPRDHESSKGLQRIDELESLNAAFAEPIWYRITDGQIDYTIGVQIHLGSHHREDARASRPASPPEDPERNVARADPKGEVAKAVAEGLDVEITTITSSQLTTDGERRLAGTPAMAILGAVDEDDATPGVQVRPGPAGEATGQISIPTDSVRSVRRLHLTLGVARASTTARGMTVPTEVLGETVTLPSGASPYLAPGALTPVDPGGGIGADVGAPAGVGGRLRLRIDWASVRVRPWPPYDMAKAIAVAAIMAGCWLLARRRLLAG